MTITIAGEFLSLFFILIIFFSYLIRSKVTYSDESVFFFRMMLVTIIGLVVEIITTFTLSYREYIPITNFIFNKVYIGLVIIVEVQISSFILFLNNDSIKYDNKGLNLRKILDICCALVIIVSLILPIEFHTVYLGDRYGVYTDGLGVNVVIGFALILFLIDLYNVIRYKNYYFKQRLFCLVLFFLLIAIAVIAREFLPGITVLFTEITLLCILIYFVVENYDIKKVTKLKELKNQASEVNDEKTKFLSNMSHEIRTNLNTIVATSNELINETQDEHLKEELKDCLNASDSLLEIVGNILDLNKIESEAITLNNVEYNLKKEIDSLVDMASLRIDNKPINFIMNIDNSIPDILYGDKIYMKQVINNLLTNAFKYTNEGSVKFTITCENEDDICHLNISVKDTGIGIKDTSKLFNKFERFNIDKISSVEGTGLGLVITKRIVDSMGGVIEVESEYGKGSKFVVKVDQQIVSNSSNVSEQTKSFDYDFGNRRILIVENDKLNLKVEKRMFSKFNFYIDDATSSSDAIELLSKNGYDLVVCDVYLDDGYEDDVLEMAKKYNIPVLCLTADAIEGAEEKYLKLGYSYYVSKPYSVKDIYNVLDKIFRK